jgi:tetratricopeptide (TPR) repeat protein
MLKSAIGIGSCLGVAIATAMLAPGAEAALAPVVGGALGWASGVAGNFGHQFCNRFYERAGAYSEKIWGLDQNEHIARGLRRAQIKATRELLRLWRATLPPYDANRDDGSHAFANLLAEWCDAQDGEKAIKQWAAGLGESTRAGDAAALRKAFETAYGAEIDARDGMAQRAAQARGLAVQAVFDDALEGALSLAQRDRARSIRDGDGLASLKAMFFREPAEGGGWFNVFLTAIGGEFKADGEFKRLWDSVQLGGISAMLLDDIQLSGERHAELKGGIERWGNGLAGAIAGVKADTEAILERQEKHHREHMEATAALRQEIAREKGVDAGKLVPLFEHLGQKGLTLDEIRERASDAITEIVARSVQGVEASNEGADIDAAIRAARQKLALLDTAGARTLLSDKIAEEEVARRQRLIPLLREKAAIERLGYDYDSAKATLKQVVALAPDSVWDWIDLGDLFVTIGSLGEAAAAFREALSAAGKSTDERGLSVSCNKIGDVQVAQGNLADALKSFREGLGITIRFAQANPDDAGWQRDLSVSHDRIGEVQVAQGNLADALKSFRDGLGIRNRFAQADPDNMEWQRDLSVSYNKIGEVQVAQGNLADALKSFRDALGISARLAQAHPGHIGWQHDLSVSYDRLGGVEVVQGNLADALKSFRDGLAIRSRLAQADPDHAGWQRDVSVSYEKIGEVQVAQGNLADALKSFSDGLGIRNRLARTDPDHAGWQRDLSVSYSKIGDVQVAQGNLTDALKSFRASHDIFARLAQADPDNMEWQRDLSVSYDRIGDVQVAQGNLEAALKSFLDGLDIANGLAQAHPDHAEWQRDLAVSYNKVGDVEVAQGNLADALKSFRDGHGITDRLAQADPDHAGWQRDLSVSYSRLGLVYRAKGDTSLARTAFVDGRAIIARLVADHPGFVQWERDLNWFDAQIGEISA